jgi:hypothetical protein
MSSAEVLVATGLTFLAAAAGAVAVVVAVFTALEGVLDTPLAAAVAGTDFSGVAAVPEADLGNFGDFVAGMNTSEAKSNTQRERKRLGSRRIGCSSAIDR